MEMKQIEDYPEVNKWLSYVGKGTIPHYKGELKTYCEWRGLNPTELIDEIEQDRKKSRREQGLPEQKLMEFYNWLLTSYKRKTGRGRPTDKVGVAKTKAAGYITAIRSFYKVNGFPLNMKSPKAAPKKENQKLNLTPVQVKLLIDHAPTIRDRAIIAMMFQGGFDVSTLCSLNYGDVKRELDSGVEPLCISVVRKKEETEHFTFVGKDSIELLKAYLNERKSKGEELKLDSPLFALEGYAKKKAKRLRPLLIQRMLRDVAIKSGIVSKEDLVYTDMNPARPHALRAAFSTILRLNGFDPVLIDFMQGHKIPYNGAYFIPPVEKVREMYAKVEDKLALTENRSINVLEKRVAELEAIVSKIAVLFKDKI
jgi:integrase/recombinase XerD